MVAWIHDAPVAVDIQRGAVVGTEAKFVEARFIHEQIGLKKQ